MKLQIINTPLKFRINILDNSNNLIFECGYHGGIFKYESNTYIVITGSEGLEYDMVELLKLEKATFERLPNISK